MNILVSCANGSGTSLMMMKSQRQASMMLFSHHLTLWTCLKMPPKKV